MWDPAFSPHRSPYEETTQALPARPRCTPLNTSSEITDDFQLITFTTPDEVTLQPDTKYWLYVNANAVGRARIQETTSDDEDTESQAGWSIGDTRLAGQMEEPGSPRTAIPCK